jgi:hypothetical protein
MIDAVLAGKDLELDRTTQFFPASIARGYKDVAATAGQEWRYLPDVVSIVVDEEPALIRSPFAEELQHLLGDLGHTALFREAGGEGGPHPLPEVGQRDINILRLTAVHPPDNVVLGLEAMRVLQRHLRLAHSAGTQDGQRVRARRALGAQVFA